MSNRVLAACVVLLIAGGFSILGANGTYVITDKWFGFVTDTKDARKGPNITADEIKKSIAGGAKYALINDIFNPNYVLVNPPAKIAPFTAQWVWVSGSITTHSLLKTNRVREDSDGGGGPEEGAFTIEISSVAPQK